MNIQGCKWVLLVLGLGLASASEAAVRSVAWEKVRVAGHWAQVITVNLNDKSLKVTVQTARGFPGTDEPFADMLARSRPTAAITGTFFSLRSLLPVGDLVVDGQLEHFGGFGTALAITPDNRVAVKRVEYGRRRDWSPYETVIGGGLLLLQGGQAVLDPLSQGFSDPRVLGRAARTAVGVTPQGKLKLVAVRKKIRLSELKAIMKKLGCREALAFDGGTSTALAYRRGILVRPGRRLTNLIVCLENVPPLYRYAPGMPNAQARDRARRMRAYQLYQWAERHRKRGNVRRAMKLLAEATRLDPLNGSYHLAYARTLRQVGTKMEVAAALAKAGRAYVSKGLYQKAIPHLAAATQLNPRHLEAHQLLILAYRALGETQAAERQWRELRFVRAKLSAPLGRGLGRWGRAVPPPQVLSLQGTLSPQRYTDMEWGLTLTLPEEWAFADRTETLLYLRHRTEPYIALLWAEPAPEEGLEEYLQANLSDLRPQQFTLQAEKFHQWPAFALTCRQTVAGTTTEARCRVIQCNEILLWLSFAAEEALFPAAEEAYQDLVEGLQLWTSAESPHPHVNEGAQQPKDAQASGFPPSCFSTLLPLSLSVEPQAP